MQKSCCAFNGDPLGSESIEEALLSSVVSLGVDIVEDSVNAGVASTDVTGEEKREDVVDCCDSQLFSIAIDIDMEGVEGGEDSSEEKKLGFMFFLTISLGRI